MVLGPAELEFWDPLYFCPNHLMIQPRRGGRPVSFELWPAQRVLAGMVMRCYQERKWLAHVKPRKEGSSTFFTGLATQHVAFKYGCHAVICAQREDVTAELARSAIRFAKTMHHPMKPKGNEKLKRTLEYPDIDSYLDCVTINQDDPARGFTGIHFLLATEICKWGEKAGPDAWTSLLSNIPDPDPTQDDDAFVVAESTPLHHGDELQKLYEDARRPDSPWLTAFIPWTMIPAYSKAPPPGWNAGEEVASYAHEHGITEGQACWMQSIGMPKVKWDLLRFQAEYPISEVDCWGLAGEVVFSRERIRSMLKQLDLGTNFTAKVAPYVEHEAPQYSHRYVIGCDPAGSWAGEDMFAIVVLDLKTCKVVAEQLQHMDAWECARRLAELGYYYNKANVYVEANGVGEAVLNPLVRIYPRTFCRVSNENSKNPERKPGWSNNKKTKVEAVAMTQELLLDGSLLIPSHRILVQLNEYRGQWDKLKRDAQGGHFDLVAALCICCWAYNREAHIRRKAQPEDPKARMEREWKKLVEQSFPDQEGGEQLGHFGRHR